MGVFPDRDCRRNLGIAGSSHTQQSVPETVHIARFFQRTGNDKLCIQISAYLNGDLVVYFTVYSEIHRA
jgi:hypothetical protein